MLISYLLKKTPVYNQVELWQIIRTPMTHNGHSFRRDNSLFPENCDVSEINEDVHQSTEKNTDDNRPRKVPIKYWKKYKYITYNIVI